MILLAEISNDVNPTFLGNWVQAALVIIFGIGAVFGIVEFFATKREVKQLEKRADSLDLSLRLLTDKLDNDKNEILASGSERGRHIHERIDALNTSHSTLAGEIKGLSSLVNKLLQSKLDEA